VDLGPLGTQFRDQLRTELERLAGAEADAAVDPVCHDEEPVQEAVTAEEGARSPDVSSRAIATRVLRVYVVQNGQRVPLGTIPMQSAIRSVSPGGVATEERRSVTEDDDGPDDVRDLQESPTLGQNTSPPPKDQQGRGAASRRLLKGSKRLIPGEAVEGGAVSGVEADEEGLTIRDKARWAIGAIKRDLAKAGAAAQEGIAEAAARKRDRREQEMAERDAAEKYFDSLDPEVQQALRGLQDLSERRLMITNTFLSGQYKAVLRKHGLAIDEYGYLVEIPKPRQEPPPRRPEDQWPYKNPRVPRPKS
jgi:hypothetical protein